MAVLEVGAILFPLRLATPMLALFSSRRSTTIWLSKYLPSTQRNVHTSRLVTDQ